MAWQKYVSNHVPDWLHVLPLGLRASVWEILRFVIAGFVEGDRAHLERVKMNRLLKTVQ